MFQAYIGIDHTEKSTLTMFECSIVILTESLPHIILNDTDWRGCQMKCVLLGHVAGDDHFFQPVTSFTSVDILQQLINKPGLTVTHDGNGNVRTQAVYLALI